MAVGVCVGDIVLHGEPATPKKWHSPHFLVMSIVANPPPKKKVAQPQIFGPCPLWPNGWMD